MVDLDLFCNPFDDGGPARCAFSDRNLHSMMPLDPTHVRLIRTYVCPIAFLSDVPSLTSWHCKFCHTTEGLGDIWSRTSHLRVSAIRRTIGLSVIWLRLDGRVVAFCCRQQFLQLLLAQGMIVSACALLSDSAYSPLWLLIFFKSLHSDNVTRHHSPTHLDDVTPQHMPDLAFFHPP
jgi:hypothetical protein